MVGGKMLFLYGHLLVIVSARGRREIGQEEGLIGNGDEGRMWRRPFAITDSRTDGRPGDVSSV